MTVRPTAAGALRSVVVVVAASVVVLVVLFFAGGEGDRFSFWGLVSFLAAAVLAVPVIGVAIRRWGRAVLSEASAGYSTSPFDLGRFWIGAAPEAPWTVGWIGWDFSGLWILDATGRVRSAPDRAVDPPGVYPSPNRPDAWELWTGSQWSGHFPRGR